MAICSVCVKEILEEDVTVWTGSRTVHQKCSENLTNDPSPGKIKREFREKSTGSVITKIDITWGNGFFLVIQFIIILNIVLIPFYLIYIIAFS